MDVGEKNSVAVLHETKLAISDFADASLMEEHAPVSNVLNPLDSMRDESAGQMEEIPLGGGVMYQGHDARPMAVLAGCPHCGATVRQAHTVGCYGVGGVVLP